MEYIIGACAAIFVILLIIKIKSKPDHFFQMAFIDFPIWKSVYYSSQEPDKRLMAKAFIEQTLDLAPKHGVTSVSEAQSLKAELLQLNPIEVVDMWLEEGLHHVNSFFGESELQNQQARFIGVLMIIALSPQPERALREHVDKANAAHRT